MQFDAKEWAKWANKQNIDSRGIHFVLTHEKLVNHGRTTPRTLVHFFESIENVKDLKKNKKLIQLLGEASLDAETTAAFLTFIDQFDEEIPSPESILYASDFQKEIYPILYKIIATNQVRNDLLFALSIRLLNYIDQSKKPLSDTQLSNFEAFLKMNFFPSDLRFVIAQEIANAKSDQIKNILSNPEISKLLLAI